MLNSGSVSGIVSSIIGSIIVSLTGQLKMFEDTVSASLGEAALCRTRLGKPPSGLVPSPLLNKERTGQVRGPPSQWGAALGGSDCIWVN